MVEIQKRFSGAKTISNSLQTNGTLLNDEWCRFLKKHNFMVGISLDGPREIHDRYRRDRRGAGTFDKVMRDSDSFRSTRLNITYSPAWHARQQ